MRKYGVENFYVELLEEVSENDSLDEREIYWISFYDSITPNGYNMISGGNKFKDDNPMYHPEIKEKVAKHLVGDLNPSKRPEVKEKIREKAIGRKASEETKKRMSENNVKYWKGKHLREETKKKISQNHGCRGKFGGLNPNSKPVLRIDKNTFEVLEEYDSISNAIKWVNKNIRKNANVSNISQACNGSQKTAFGYIWKFKNKV